MQTTTHPTAGTTGGKEATMATTESTTETIARLRADGWKAARILSGLGHPGYGEKFAAAALANIERYGLTAHEAVYGGREAQRKVWGL
jgi:hypothetical protein